MRKTLNVLAVVVGLVFVGVALVYWMTPANMLPSYLPGYNPALSSVHFKHGLGAFIVGAALFVFAWFRTGKKSTGAAAGGSVDKK